jgi:hypothetical protein
METQPASVGLVGEEEKFSGFLGTAYENPQFNKSKVASQAA